MKTYAEIGTEVGELVERKNAAYGSSFAKCGQYLRLLFPDGLPPDRYEDALLLARDFDKSMRIATDRDAFGESPYLDKAGYGILGAHMHWQKKEDRAPWQGNVSDPAATSSSPEDTTAGAAPSTKRRTTTSEDAKTTSPASSEPKSCSEPPTSAPALTATEAVSGSVEGDASRTIPCTWCGAELPFSSVMWAINPFHEERFCSREHLEKYREANQSAPAPTATEAASASLDELRISSRQIEILIILATHHRWLSQSEIDDELRRRRVWGVWADDLSAALTELLEFGLIMYHEAAWSLSMRGARYLFLKGLFTQ